MKVFFDTNILIKLLDKRINLPQQPEYFTFEKCIYEVKNGYKSKLYNPKFLNSLLQNSSGRQEETNNQDNDLKDYFLNFIDLANYTKKDLNLIKKAFNKYNLKFEYGIASEYEFKDLSTNDEVGLIKNLFKNLKILLRTVLLEVEEKICSYNIHQLLYEQIFGSDLSLTNFREILDDAVINTKDMEIIFAALKIDCKLFLSSDLALIKETSVIIC